MKLLMPSHARRVQHYSDAVPLFQRHHVVDQLAAMYHPVVQLNSGGYLVINPTEALVRAEEHTSELQSLMRISYAVFCLTNKTTIFPVQHCHQLVHHAFNTTIYIS